MMTNRSRAETEPQDAMATPLAGLSFVKMNGLGNDFVVLDARQMRIALTAAETRAIADRKTGVGCDQLIVIEPATDADAFMRILNADGSEVAACGNATRCIADLLMSESGQDGVSIRTAADRLTATRGVEPGTIAVDMGRPALGWADIPLAGPMPASASTATVALDTSSLDANLPPSFSAVSMGNPHAIFFVADVEAHDLGRFGPVLERHPLFPQRANISLVSVVSRTHLRQRVWERGAGLTLACGTGACAAAVAAIRAGFCDHQLVVSLPGGDLTIDWQADGHVIMTGAVARNFNGTLPQFGMAGAD